MAKTPCPMSISGQCLSLTEGFTLCHGDECEYQADDEPVTGLAVADSPPSELYPSPCSWGPTTRLVGAEEGGSR